MRRTPAAVGSALFFAAAPGTVAVLIPWWITGWQPRAPLPVALMLPIRLVGALLILAGAVVLVHAFVRFVVEGFGTPVPVAPPERLVVGGFYRYVRNPMYVAIFSVIIGQAMLLGRSELLGYAAVVAVVVTAFVRRREEPLLRRRFGAEYDAYRAAVPGWLPRLRPHDP
ncbi:methyltransferase family protein [Nonomuraea sp. NPDC049714]|uniref:methyltransferase family protein n=1 Tax=Nonomuraea sp. NPDC049714 TaxID=3364357 RepID=UPI0037A54226